MEDRRDSHPEQERGPSMLLARGSMGMLSPVLSVDPSGVSGSQHKEQGTR